jgi:hypothetical protein
MSSKAEEQIQLALVQYIRYQYPDVLFRSDAAGFKLSVGQAKKMKALNGGIRAWPDLFLAKPKLMQSKDGLPVFKHGLFLELKKDGTKILKKDGELVADKHIREQAKVLRLLERRGYQAQFAVGFNQAKQIIDEYIGRKKGGVDIVEF